MERPGRADDIRGIVDISAPLSEANEPWPGDEPVRLEHTARIADGDSVNLGRLTTSTHNGTHADAPLHVSEGGAPVDRLPLEAFLGPAVVLDAPEALELDGSAMDRAVPEGHRVLLRWGRADHRAFPESIPAVPEAWIRRLSERRVPLLGTDAPSLDPVDSTELPAHHACVEAGIQILENLALAHVDGGLYQLHALPLRLEGADASPVRAVLIDDGNGQRKAGSRRPTDAETTSTDEEPEDRHA